MERQRREEEEEEEEAAHRGMDAKIERMEEAEFNPYIGAAERIRAGANEIDDEKKIGYQDSPPSQSAPDLQAGLRALYEGRKAGEVRLSDIACTPENIQKPKKWWEKAGEWFTQNPTGQRVKNVAVGFLSGFIAGALTGAIGGSIVGSFAGGVGAGPGALGSAIVGGVIGGISGLVTGLLIKPDTPTVQVAKQAAIWGGVTGLLGGTGASVAGLQGFAHGGQAWHIGLQTAAKLNIVHIGIHPDYGFHIAFGAVKSYVADLHIYLQKDFPFFRIWRP